ncbi:T9SS type A sorting domain-containing protein [Candidatus Eisenbacteria bacterium]|uniref:T9SS type A sorting domain-containing protein n=1 Tax=Eiseniibacteriota bacterium TaxID=2212470 RepID=A0ABV6YLX7_UNCEI
MRLVLLLLALLSLSVIANADRDDPLGACCDIFGNCQVLTEADCISQNGEWLGPGTDCSIGCQGACCYPDGHCDIQDNPLHCAVYYGMWQGYGTDCDTTECPIILGACCLSDGTCIEISELNCDTIFLATWMGLGTDCSPTSCMGACCTTTDFDHYLNCDVTGWSDCDLPPFHAWGGRGTDCFMIECVDLFYVDCCFADGSCETLTIEDCFHSGGVVGACCDVTDVGACCLPDGVCAEATPLECAQLGGVWLDRDGPDPCYPDPCGHGACCLPNGDCQTLYEAACYDLMGDWYRWVPYCDSFCPQPGACCFLDGSCQNLVHVDCYSAGGTWHGDSTDCATLSCPQPPGACCFDGGGCEDLSEADCVAQGGVWNGFETDCATFECPPTGACCWIEGVCYVLLEADCLDILGSWYGVGTDCDPNPCPQPPGPGACCLEDGSCRFIEMVHCDILGGDFTEYGLPCDPNPCLISDVGGLRDLPSGPYLSLPSPNPALGRLAFSLELPEEGTISLTLFDVTGKAVNKLVDNTQYAAGVHVFSLDPNEHDQRGLPAGIYYLRLEVGGFQETRRIVVAH